jgi:OOP family OmpA-OmpF porin
MQNARSCTPAGVFICNFRARVIPGTNKRGLLPPLRASKPSSALTQRVCSAQPLQCGPHGHIAPHKNLGESGLNTIKYLLATAGLLVLSSAASADTYLGAGFGMARSNAAERLEQTFAYDSGATKDHNKAGINLYGGYSFNKNFAIEGSYLNFGKYEIKGKVFGTDSADSLAAQAFALSAVGSVPLNDSFSLDAKLGVGLISQKYRCINLCGGISDKTTNRAVLAAGIGAHWFVTKHFAVRAGYEHFGGAKFEIEDSLGSKIGKSADYGLLYTSAEVRF